ncbi:MAG TPA: hypothetical protein ENN80_14285 [Candidatus Hydrogenedentes bacterium]|nr:hypothetical protein [Candidatus Hydrogenedentota bacterium]
MKPPPMDTQPESVIALDSFMDIVTNVIGALFFVVIFAALCAFGIQGKILTPILSHSATHGVVFECRGNTVLFPDFDGLLARAQSVWDKAVQQGVTELEPRLNMLRNAGIHNAYYRYTPGSLPPHATMGAFKDLPVKFEPVPKAYGENGLDLQRQDSRFAAKLARLDPDRQHVFLFVQTDSFDIFHVVRRKAIDAGFAVGWEPMQPGEPLQFGDGGVVNIGDHF